MKQLDFKLFAIPVSNKLAELRKKVKEGKGYFVQADIPKEEFWNLYLNSYPSEVNGIFRERKHYDGNYDRAFVNGVGRLIYLDKETLERDTIWNIKVEGYYQDVANVLDSCLFESGIFGLWLPTEPVYGSKPNVDNHDTNIVWDHFYFKNNNPCTDVGTKQGVFQASVSVFKRGLNEFKLDQVETVLDLCEANNIYRGAEHISTLKQLIKDINHVQNTALNDNSDDFYYVETLKRGYGVRVRNTSIGTLLTDLAEGRPLEQAVKAFEDKVAPHNYKRTTALITPKMVQLATKKLEELGLRGAITRRPAFLNDIPKEEFFFVSENKPLINDSLDLLADVVNKSVKLNNLTEIPLVQFLTETLNPNVTRTEILFEPKHRHHLMCLSTDSEETKGLLAWDNPFAWTYAGGVADAIKERVKEAGGKIDARIRFSLAWHNADDLDLHLRFQKDNYLNRRVYYRNRNGFNFTLDTDMNSCGAKISSEPVFPVENIFSDAKILHDGEYTLLVNNYMKVERNPAKEGFTIQVEIDGEVREFTHAEPLNHKDTVSVMSFNVVDGVIGELAYNKHAFQEGSSIQETWGTKAGTFVDVNAITLSPNHWGNNNKGAKHLLMFMDGCKPEEPFRPFFNEQLHPSLNEHRKVFEVLGSKSLIEPQEGQLSGLGFNTGDGTLSFTVRLTHANGSVRDYLVKF